MSPSTLGKKTIALPSTSSDDIDNESVSPGIFDTDLNAVKIGQNDPSSERLYRKTNK
jgi:hypothetical protein